MAGCSVLITDGSREHQSIALLHDIIGQVGISNHMREVFLLPAWNMSRKRKKKVLRCPLWKKTTEWLCCELNVTCQVHLLELVLNLKQLLNSAFVPHDESSEELSTSLVWLEPHTAPAWWSYSHYPAPAVPAFLSTWTFQSDALCHLILFIELCITKEILWF